MSFQNISVILGLLSLKFPQGKQRPVKPANLRVWKKWKRGHGMALHLEKRYLESESNFQFLTLQNMDDPWLNMDDPWLLDFKFLFNLSWWVCWNSNKEQLVICSWLRNFLGPFFLKKTGGARLWFSPKSRKNWGGPGPPGPLGDYIPVT